MHQAKTIVFVGGSVEEARRALCDYVERWNDFRWEKIKGTWEFRTEDGREIATTSVPPFFILQRITNFIIRRVGNWRELPREDLDLLQQYEREELKRQGLL